MSDRDAVQKLIREAHRIIRAAVKSTIGSDHDNRDAVQAAELWEAARLQREGYVPEVGATPFNDPEMARMLPDAKQANEAITAALAEVPERFRGSA